MWKAGRPAALDTGGAGEAGGGARGLVATLTCVSTARGASAAGPGRAESLNWTSRGSLGVRYRGGRSRGRCLGDWRVVPRQPGAAPQRTPPPPRRPRNAPSRCYRLSPFTRTSGINCLQISLLVCQIVKIIMIVWKSFKICHFNRFFSGKSMIVSVNDFAFIQAFDSHLQIHIFEVW